MQASRIIAWRILPLPLDEKLMVRRPRNDQYQTAKFPHMKTFGEALQHAEVGRADRPAPGPGQTPDGGTDRYG